LRSHEGQRQQSTNDAEGEPRIYASFADHSRLRLERVEDNVELTMLGHSEQWPTFGGGWLMSDDDDRRHAASTMATNRLCVG